MIRRALGLVLLVLQLGCAATRGADPADLPELWRGWCGSGAALRQRYDFTVDADGRRFDAEGFIVLDPQAETLDAVLLSPLGIKLATLRVTPDAVRSLQDPSPLPERLILPLGLALRRGLLLAWPCLPNGTAGAEAERDALAHGIGVVRGHGEMTLRAFRKGAAWSVTAKRQPCRWDAALALTVRDELSRFVLTLTPTEVGDDDE